MARGPTPTVTGRSPAARNAPCAAGRLAARAANAGLGGPTGQVVFAVGLSAAAWLLLVAFSLLLNLVVDGSDAHAQAAPDGGRGKGSNVSPVTVTSPPRIGTRSNLAACPEAGGAALTSAKCAAVALDAKAKLAAQTAGPEAVVPPASADRTDQAARIGLGTPAAAAQQPGTPFGKPLGYIPPPPPSAAPPGGPFARAPR